MKREYVKPVVESDKVLEQTSLACGMSQLYGSRRACGQYIKDEPVPNALFEVNVCDAWVLEDAPCSANTLLS